LLTSRRCPETEILSPRSPGSPRKNRKILIFRIPDGLLFFSPLAILARDIPALLCCAATSPLRTRAWAAEKRKRKTTLAKIARIARIAKEEGEEIYSWILLN
jgi:hypothetical protein